jgi:tetratricopeptide (TPR) repeat protein
MSDLLLKDLQEQIARDDVAFVVGAGVSLAATRGCECASWTGLLRHGVQRCIDLGRLDDQHAATLRDQIDSGDMDLLLPAAEVVSTKLGAATAGPEWSNWLRDSVGSLKPSAPAVLEALHDLGVVLATTNYDGLLEAVTQRGTTTWKERPDAVGLLREHGRAERSILHLHGFWARPDTVVLGIRSYERLLGDEHAQNVLHVLQTVKSLVFVGFGGGLADPNFGALLEWSGRVMAQDRFRRFRLCRQDEVEALRRQHPPEQRIFPISYGQHFEDLTGFLRSLGGPRCGLPSPLSPSHPPSNLPPVPFCYGRDAEREDLISAVMSANSDVPPEPTPVLGAPGIGKSTLCLKVLHDRRVAARYGARRYFIRCDGLHSRFDLASEIGRILGLPLSPNIEVALAPELSKAPTILVLDNLETPWERDILPVEELLGELATVQALWLVVSLRGNERPGGVKWRAKSILLNPLSPPAARDSFLAIAGQEMAGDPNLNALLEEVGFVPLAISLMAHAAQGETNLSGLWRRWKEERTAMLKRGGGQHRLTNLELSYQLSLTSPRVSPEARRLLALLAQLPNGLAWMDLTAVFPVMADAAANTLRKAGLAFDDAHRLRVLAPLREFVRREDGERVPHEDLQRLMSHFLRLVATFGGKVGTHEGAAAVKRLVPEAANVERMLDLALSGSLPEAALAAVPAWAEFVRFTGLGSARALRHASKLHCVLGNKLATANCLQHLGTIARARADYQRARGCYSIAGRFYQSVAAAAVAAPAAQRADDLEHRSWKGLADCLHDLGDISRELGNATEALDKYSEALAWFGALQDELGQANCIKGIGDLMLDRSAYNAARLLYKEALALYHYAANSLGKADSIKSLGDVACASRRFPLAQRCYDTALRLYHKLGHSLGVANVHMAQGDVELGWFHLEAADQFYGQAHADYRKVGNVFGEAHCQRRLADLARERAHTKAATRGYEAALAVFRKLRHRLGEASCLEGLGLLAEAQRDTSQAEKHLSAALKAYARVNNRSGVASCTKSLGDLALGLLQYDEARQRYQEALRTYQEGGDLLGRANCHYGLGMAARANLEATQAEEHYRRALTCYVEAGDLPGQAHCYWRLADLERERCDLTGAGRDYRAALLRYHGLRSATGQANCIKRLGDLALIRSEHHLARRCYRAAFRRYHQQCLMDGQAECLLGLGDLEREVTRYSRASRFYRHALKLYADPKLDDKVGQANCGKGQGDIALAQSQYGRALAAYETALVLYQKARDTHGEAQCQHGLGSAHRELSEYEKAHKRYDAAQEHFIALRHQLGRANCIKGRGDIELENQNYGKAQALYDEALRLYRLVPNPLGEAHCVKSLGDTAFAISRILTEKAGRPCQADLQRRLEKAALRYREIAHQYYEQARVVYTKVHHQLGEANYLKAKGDLALLTKDQMAMRGVASAEPNPLIGEAHGAYRDAVNVYTIISNRQGLANCLMQFGNLYSYRHLPDPDQARQHFEAALRLYQQLNNELGVADAHKALGDTAYSDSQHDLARNYYLSALERYGKTGNRPGKAFCLLSLSQLATAQHNDGDAKYYGNLADQAFKEFSEPDYERFMNQSSG